MSEKIKVALIFGGRSAEHEVSIHSAGAIYNHLDKKKYSIIPIFIDRKGNWFKVASPDLSVSDQDNRHQLSFMPWIQGSDVLISKPDIVFPVLHGPFGEDGTLQGLCEMADIPYVGAGVLSSALCMDKAVAKSLFIHHDLLVPDFLVVKEEEWEHQEKRIVDKIKKDFDLPLFIKPANLGSSVGISKVKSLDTLRTAFKKAFQYDRKVLVEEGIQGREIECSVLGNDKPEASLPGELIPHREFYDYRDKYIEGKTKFMIPCSLSTQICEKIQGIAIQAFQALDCSGMARVDFFVENDTARILLNEVNTIPGFTEISMYPKLWEASGIPFAELLDKLIDLGFERYEQSTKKGREFSA